MTFNSDSSNCKIGFTVHKVLNTKEYLQEYEPLKSSY